MCSIKIKVGIYNPYIFSTFGGGEKYTLDLLNILSENDSYDIYLITKKQPEVKDSLRTRKYFISQLDTRTRFKVISLDKYRDSYYLNTRNFIGYLTRKFDLFINFEFPTFIKPLSKRSIYVMQQPPYIYLHKSIPFERIINNYSAIVVYSNFTRRVIEAVYSNLIPYVRVIYPGVSYDSLTRYSVNIGAEKEDIIINIGRFISRKILFPSNNKCQDYLINAFNYLYSKYHPVKVRLYLTGSLDNRKENIKFFEYCLSMRKTPSIALIPNISPDLLRRLLMRAKVYWHATGACKSKKNIQPAELESFGISVIEAMAFGAVPVAYYIGGTADIIQHGINGFLFRNTEELIEYTLKIITSEKLFKQLSYNAQERVKDFNINIFKSKWLKLLSELWS
jgi:glycosyltransferase involved in cell wall biosynthesis